LIHTVSPLVQQLAFPLHSLRRNFPQASRAAIAAKLDSLPENSLFTVLSPEDGSDWFAALRSLPWDSEFFGRGVGRIEFLGTSAESHLMSAENMLRCENFVRKVLLEASARRIEYLSVQVDSADALLLSVLQRLGFVVLDTIICYLLDLSQFDGHAGDEASEPLADIEQVRRATAADMDAVADISRICFGDTRYNANRFNSDPLLAGDKVAELYGLWAMKSISGEMAEKVFVFDQGKGCEGFITVAKPDGSDLKFGLKLASIPLNAVAPHSHGRGIYSALVRHALTKLKADGHDWVDIRTQLPNNAVHRTWQKLGAIAALSYHTLRFGPAK
jgi:GNAT superfamily N-acetyltransferase